MKHRSQILAVPLLAFVLLGAGCGFSHAPIPPAPIEEPAGSPSRPAVLPTGQGELVQGSETVTTSTGFILLNGGSATITRNGQSAPAVDNAELSAGDRIVVTNGTVSIIYPESGESRLSPGTDVTVVSDPSSSGLLAELRLAAGRVWTRFDRLFGNDEQFSVAGNGVVATVRGTGFGFGIENGNVDVQVADHDVDVAHEEAGSVATSSIRLAPGEGIRVNALQLRGSVSTVRSMVRKLSAAERSDLGFRFGSQIVARERIRRPPNLIRLFRAAPVLPSELDRRLQLLRNTTLLRAGFLAPTRSLLPTDIAPTTVTPVVGGPTQ